MTVALSVTATLIAGAVCAGENYLLCHNIGGPRDLGANCEATGNCTILLDDGSEEGVLFEYNDKKHFLGILIGAGGKSRDAHLAHGDGYAIFTFDPALHLASVEGPHRASNVECLAERRDTELQPPEPGN